MADEVLDALARQERQLTMVLAAIGTLASSVNALCELLKDEDPDPEDEPVVSLDGEAGGRPREPGQDLG